MSLAIPIRLINNNARAKIHYDLLIDDEKTREKVALYSIIDKQTLIVPFAYGSKLSYTKNVDRFPQNPSYATNPLSDSTLTSTSLTLRDEQRVVFDEAYSYLLKNGSTLLSLYTGFGKTVTAIALALALNTRVIVVVNKLILLEQWEKSIRQFANTSAQVLTSSTKTLNENTNFFLVNAINISKIPLLTQLKPNTYTVIVDEAHQILARVLAQGLSLLFPRYLIGLSATPYRLDGFHKLFELYFGDTTKITRAFFRPHKVHIIYTGIFIPTTYQSDGKVNWSAVINYQASLPKRDKIVISIVKEHPERTFLIVVKRVEHAQTICTQLVEQGIAATCLAGKVNCNYDGSKVIVGCHGKIGTGFDYPALDALILACDTRDYFIQILGRVFRQQVGIPLIFDIVDNHPILNNHLCTRMQIYEEHGGELC